MILFSINKSPPLFLIFPLIFKEFSSTSKSTPEFFSESAISIKRLLSLNFSSLNPLNEEIPDANEAATKSIGYSSINLGAISSDNLIDFKVELSTKISPTISPLIFFCLLF